MDVAVSTGSTGKSGQRIALCGIVKNEAPYIIDWISWHRALGFTDFIIADNDSTDGTGEILAQLQRRHILRTFKVPTRFHWNPQRDAYVHAAELASRLGLDWIAFFDADEFLMPSGPNESISAFLGDLPQSCGSISVNWAVYGSSGHISASSEPVPYRFTRRSPMSSDPTSDAGINLQYKSIIRPTAFAGKMPNSHHLHLKSGFSHWAADRRPLIIKNKVGGVSDRIVWEPFRLNHYVVRSWSEFYKKKMTRGLADDQSLTRSVRFFQFHDLNDVEEDVPLSLRSAFDSKRESLIKILDNEILIDSANREIMEFIPPAISDLKSGPAELNLANKNVPKRYPKLIRSIHNLNLTYRRFFPKKINYFNW